MKHHIAMFRNEKKENDKQPDYVGAYKEKGLKIAGWINETPDGKKYMKVTLETDVDFSEQPQTQQNPKPTQMDNSFDDDIPF